MELWHIRGGNRLEGACFVQGSKNASLPILAASIICPASTELLNVPQLRDVDAALRILRHLGCWAEQSGGEVTIDSRNLSCCSIPHSLMVEMRSSVIFMGALLARCGEARLSLPGGCQLGKRPIDLHLAALRKMGAEIEEDRGEIFCRAEALKGAEIVLPFPSVGATENIMLAACAARGETVIHGAAREPEIAALQDYLKAMGADVRGAGTDTVTVGSLSPEKHIACRIIPDRIVASTIACAAACTGGNVELRGIDPRQFSTVLRFLNQAGCDIISTDRSVRLRSEGELKAVGEISTAPYPGFPTDAQPVLMAALLRSRGTTVFEENLFENRYRHVDELPRMGADIRVAGRVAVVTGTETLHGTNLRCTDLRGGAALCVAALAAEGQTHVSEIGHIDRGYQDIVGDLRDLGADIARIETEE